MTSLRWAVLCAGVQAENERMHLITFLQLSQPGYLTRAAVLLTQGILCACCLPVVILRYDQIPLQPCAYLCHACLLWTSRLGEQPMLVCGAVLSKTWGK